MLFAHGFGCDQTMWRHLIPAFEDDYLLVLFDHVGSGRSDTSAYDPARYSTLNGYARDVLEICDLLDLTNIVFVGHSVSGTIGLLAAMQVPERFEHMVLIGPSPCFTNEVGYVGGFERETIEGLLAGMDGNYQEWAASLASLVVKNPERPDLAKELVDSLCAIDPAIARAFARATFLGDYRSILGQVKVPSLVLQSEDDALAPLEVGRYLGSHLRGSTLEVLPTSGHCPHVSHPLETANAIRAYLGAPNRDWQATA